MSEAELAKYPGLTERAGVWYVRKRVPVDLVHVDRRGQVRLSLRTSDKKEAVRRYPAKLAEIEAGFAKLRADQASADKLTSALSVGAIDRLSERDLEALAVGWWRSREDIRNPILDEFEDPADALERVEQNAPSPRNLDIDHAQAATDRLLVDAGAAAYPRKLGAIQTKSLYPAVDRSTSQYRYLYGLVARALELEPALARDQITQGNSAPRDALFNPTGDQPGQPMVRAGATRCIRDLIKTYRSEREAIHGKESTDRKYGLLFVAMTEVWGADTLVSSLTRADCVRLLAFLRALPPNAKKRWPRLSLTEAVAKAQEGGLRGLAPNTVGSYLQNLSAILRWAENEGWGVKVNTRDLLPARRPAVRRRGFTAEELSTLFAALEGVREKQPTRYWVPALALFSGARAGELCQLRKEDVVEVGGVACLNLSEFNAAGQRVEGKRLKTAVSERLVPIHSELVGAGFLDFVASKPEGGLLFDDLSPGTTGSQSHQISKWFGRFKKTVGFSEPSLVFHSFRHGFRDACRLADISDETARALGGWAGVNQATHYGDRGAVPVLDRAMRKISYGEFRLSRS